jgi:hypothetical protein
MDLLGPTERPSLSTVRPAAAPDRQVGIELEFLGPGARAAASALADHLGGHVEAEDAHAYRVLGSSLGDLAVDLDLRHVHPQRHTGRQGALGTLPAAWLGTLLSPVVPRELITRPIPVARLGEFDGAVAALRQAGARGRGRVFFDALSLHFNVDPPGLDARSITSALKAFLALGPGLRREISRGDPRLAAVLPPDYPEAYARQVLDPAYWPDLDVLIDDYLRANPTRKRALDFLPLFTFLDEARVRSVLPREKIGRRPVLHYRLPLAHPGEPGWSVLPDWERWLRVERLAADPDALAGLDPARP